MFDDVVVGTGPRGVSAMKVDGPAGEVGVSANKVSFWISGAYLGLDMTVYRDTDDGRRLDEMITAKSSEADIRVFVEDVLLSHVHPVKLKMAVSRALDAVYEKGKRAAQTQMRRALGIGCGDD